MPNTLLLTTMWLRALINKLNKILFGQGKYFESGGFKVLPLFSVKLLDTFITNST